VISDSLQDRCNSRVFVVGDADVAAVVAAVGAVVGDWDRLVSFDMHECNFDRNLRFGRNGV
jgi:hypothetical protein